MALLIVIRIHILYEAAGVRCLLAEDPLVCSSGHRPVLLRPGSQLGSGLRSQLSAGESYHVRVRVILAAAQALGVGGGGGLRRHCKTQALCLKVSVNTLPGYVLFVHNYAGFYACVTLCP